MKISGNKILITGGASGIGLGLTERFVEEGNTVIVCGRRAQVLENISKKIPSVITRKCDLTITGERESLFHWIVSVHPDVNVLVNNAGIQQRMTIDDEDFYPRAKEEIAINIEAQVHIISLFLRLKSLDTIINVTSGLGYVPMARVAVYSATKAFFHSFTLSLRHLLKSRNIEVIELVPPAVNTDLGGVGIHLNATPVGEFVESVFEQLKQGKAELTHGFTGHMPEAGAEELMAIFLRMNGQG